MRTPSTYSIWDMLLVVALSALLTDAILGVFAPLGSASGLCEVCMSADGTAVWLLDGRAFLRSQLRGAVELQRDGYASAVALSPDGDLLAIQREGVGIELVDVATSTPIRLLRRREARVRSLALCGGARPLVAVRSEADVEVWDAYGADLIVTVAPHVGPPDAIAVSPDGKYLALGCDSAFRRAPTVEIWSLNPCGQIATLEGPDEGFVASLMFSPNGARLAVQSSYGGHVRVFRIPDAWSGRAAPCVEFKGGLLAFSPDAERALLVKDDTASILELGSAKVVARSRLPRSEAVGATFFGVEGSAFLMTADGALMRWELGGEIEDIEFEAGSRLDGAHRLRWSLLRALAAFLIWLVLWEYGELRRWRAPGAVAPLGGAPPARHDVALAGATCVLNCASHALARSDVGRGVSLIASLPLITGAVAVALFARSALRVRTAPWESIIACGIFGVVVAVDALALWFAVMGSAMC